MHRPLDRKMQRIRHRTRGELEFRAHTLQSPGGPLVDPKGTSQADHPLHIAPRSEELVAGPQQSVLRFALRKYHGRRVARRVDRARRARAEAQ